MSTNLLPPVAPWHAGKGQAPILRRFRSRTTACVLQLALLGWSLSCPRLQAIYVPDENQAPVWLAIPGSSPTPEAEPATSDNDENGIPDWRDFFNTWVANGNLAYWQGGTWIVDGVSTSFGGQWVYSSGGAPLDADGDLLADGLDAYPNDPTNHSFYWAGGTFVLNNVFHTFRSGWYAGSSADGNSNAVPDSLDSWFYNPEAHGTLQYWAGGTININGQDNTYGPVYYYAPTYVDTDQDGLPNEIDPFPEDPWNNHSFSWPGGDFYINAIATHFPPATYGGEFADGDIDGIPDVADPLPEDRYNNSAWWQGGSFTIDGQTVSLNGQYHLADAGDLDMDGMPDDIDPLPESASNWHSYDWAGGRFYINNQDVIFEASTFQGVWHDTDSDGIPDVVDPYPSDSGNGNVTQEYYWPGGTFWISGSNQTFQGATYPGSWSDADLDQIPDPADPFPTDAVNGNPHFHWLGGVFTIDHVSVTFLEGDYAGDWADSDADGIPDAADIYYPTDANNGNDRYTWAGGTFRIDNTDQTLPGGVFMGSWTDTDWDGIPDPADPYREDSSNGNTSSSSYDWAGGTFRIDNHDQYFPPATYGGGWADIDQDLIPDPADPYPGTSINGNTFYDWEGGYFLVDDAMQYFAGGTFDGDFADEDRDTIPDMQDPYPHTEENGNTYFYWQGGTFTINDAGVTFPPGTYIGDPGNDDGDDIPNAADPYPGDSNNGNTPPPPPPPHFYWAGGYFPIDNHLAYYAPGEYEGGDNDEDGDGLPDVVDPHLGDTANGMDWSSCFRWSGGPYLVDAHEVTWTDQIYPGRYVDTDGDLIPDNLDPHYQDPANNTAWWNGNGYYIDGTFQTLEGRYHLADALDDDGDLIPDDIDPYPTDRHNHSDYGYTWPSGNAEIVVKFWDQDYRFSPQVYELYWHDEDGDGIPDNVDLLPHDYYNGNDTDGDGFLDSLEVLYPGYLDPTNPDDADYLRADGITYRQAYANQIPLNQMLPAALDTDNDGMSDVFEITHDLNRKSAVDAVNTTVYDFVLNVEKARLGLPLDVAVSAENYAGVTGVSRSEVLAHHSSQLSIQENDWDGDGISNIDEVIVFHTDCRRSASCPETYAIWQALVDNKCSATTLMSFGHLIGYGSGTGTGGTGTGTGGGTGTGTGGSGSEPDADDGTVAPGALGDPSAPGTLLGVVLYTPLQ